MRADPRPLPEGAAARRRRSRPLLTAAVMGLVAVACGPVATLTRPEGTGGWSAERRDHELARIARRARVDLDGGAEGARAPDDGRVPGAGSGAPPAATGPLDLATALAQARRENLPLAEARRAVAIARQRVWQARGRLLPATTGSGRYTWYSDPLTNSSVTVPGADEVRPTIEIRDREIGTVDGTMVLPLDLAGEIRFALAAAQAGYRGEAARLWATELEQATLVVGAYYTLLEATRLRRVTEQTIALERQQLANAEDRFARGRLTKNELLVVQVGLRTAEQELMQRDLAIDEARWTVNRLTGAPIDAPTRLADVTGRPTLPPLPEALRTAYRENPILQALLEEQQRLEATATSLVRSRLPSLSGGGAIEYSTTDVLDPQTVGSGFVGFAWDLGTDTRREARIAAARIEAARHRTRIARELREVERALRASYRATEERLAALDTASVAVGQAEENLRIRRQQFDAGRATSEDVLDAEALLATQRATLASALYQAHTRRAEVQQLMGRPLGELAALAPAPDAAARPLATAQRRD